MTDNAHIFTPQDDSIAERLKAYRSVREAYESAKASLERINDPEWSESLGEKQEIQEAYEICKHSLDMATNSLSEDELNEALSQDPVANDELKNIAQEKRRSEMKEIRNNQNSNSNQQSQKR